jgi:hypothetical protein
MSPLGRELKENFFYTLVSVKHHEIINLTVCRSWDPKTPEIYHTTLENVIPRNESPLEVSIDSLP